MIVQYCCVELTVTKDVPAEIAVVTAPAASALKKSQNTGPEPYPVLAGNDKFTTRKPLLALGANTYAIPVFAFASVNALLPPIVLERRFAPGAPVVSSKMYVAFPVNWAQAARRAKKSKRCMPNRLCQFFSFFYSLGNDLVARVPVGVK